MTEPAPQEQPETKQNQETQGTAPATAAPADSNKIRVKFNGVNIPGGQAIKKVVRMPKEKTMEFIMLNVIHKFIKDKEAVFVCFM